MSQIRVSEKYFISSIIADFNPYSIYTGNPLSDDDCESVSREASPCSESPRPISVGSESPNENICTMPNQMNNNNNNNNNKISSNVQLQSGNVRVTREQKVGVSIR